MSVAEAQARIPSAEFAEWMSYHSLEPFGEERADWRNGLLISTIVGLISGEEVSPSDFILGSPQAPEPGPTDPKAETRLFLEAMGALRKES